MPQRILIRGSGISLRDFTLHDVDDVVSIVGDDRVTRWLSFDSKDRIGAERMIATAIHSSQAEPRTEYYLGVADSLNDRVIGFARIAVNSASAAKVGYAIHADHWGKGHATNAARGIVEFGFRNLSLHRITAAVGPDNYASQAVLKRLGFTQEGRLRDHVFTNGAWRDSLLYSILTNEELR